MPFGLTEEQKRWAIQQHGFNPDEYDMDESGFIGIKQQSNQPAAFATDRQAGSISTEPKPEQWGAGQTALHTAIRKAPGAAIGGSAAALSLPWAAGAAGPSFGTSLLVPLILGYLGSKAGDVGSEALLDAMNPEQQKQMAEAQSTHPLAATAGAISTMPLGGFNPNPMNMIRAGGTLPKLLTGMRPTTPELQNLLNVGVGAGAGAGAGIAEPLLSGQDVHGGDVALSALLGGLFNKPNAIGRRMGFHNPVPEQVHPDINALINQPAETAQQPISTEPQATPTIADLMAQMATGGAPYERGRVARGRLTPGGIEIMARVQENPFKGLRKPDITTEEELARLIGEGGIDIGAAKPTERRTFNMPDVATEPIPAERALTLAEPNRFRQAEPQPHRLFSEESALPEKKRPTTDFEKETAAKLEAAGIPTKPTSVWNKLLSDWGFTERNIVVMPDETIVNETTGKPIAGDSFVRQGIKTALARFNPGKAALDTIPHELFHVFFNDLRNSPKAYDKMLVRKAESYVNKSPEFAKINEQRTAQQLETWTPEEFLATEHGLQYINDRLNLAGEKSFSTWWNDLTSHIKTRYTTDATQADFRRLLNYRFINDPSFHEYFKTGIKLKGGVNTANAQETQSKKEKGSILNTGAQENVNKTSPDTIAKEFGLDYKPWNMAGIGEHWQFTTPTGETFYTKSGASRDEIKTLFDVKMKQFGRKSLQQDESSLTPINHPDIIDLLDNTIETAKAEKLTTDAGREVKTVLSTQVNLPEKLRTALEDVNASSLTDWIRFKVQLTKAIESGDLVDVPKQPLSKLTPEPLAKPVPTEIAPAAKEPKPQQIVQKPSPDTLSIDEARDNAATIREKLLADAKKWETVTPSAEELHQHSDDIARYIKMSDEYLQQRKNDKRFSDESSLNPDNIVRKAKGEGNTGYPFSADEFGKGSALNEALTPVMEKANKMANAVGATDVANETGAFLTPHNQQEESSLPKKSIYETPAGKLILPLAPEIEKIRVQGEAGKKAAPALEEFYRKMSRFQGQLEQSLITALRKVRPSKDAKEFWTQDNEDYRTVVKYRDIKQDGEQPDFELTPKQKEINQAVDDNLKKSFDVRESYPNTPELAGLAHDTGQTPFYLPHTMSREAGIELAERPSSVKSQGYYKDFVAYQMKNGKTAADRTKEGADANWKVVRGAFTKESHNLAQQFGPIDKASGIGLPRSMREQNLMDRMSRFNRRFARRIAYYDAIESNKEASNALFDSATGLESNQATKNVLEDIYGVREHIEANRNALMGIVRAGMMGPLTGTKDFTSNITLGLQHQDASQVLPGIKFAFENWKNNYAKALEHGVVRDNLAALEMGEGGIINTVNVLRRARDVINIAQGRQLLETATRITAYGQGKYLAIDGVNSFQKSSMSFQQKKFLNDFMPEWKEYKNKPVPEQLIDEAAARYVESVQGTYDYRGLPAITMKGSLAPVLSLARWNVEKFNNFVKYNIEPARAGNWKPLLMSTIGMLIGGTAVNALVEEATGKKEKTPKLSEIVEAKDEEQWKLASYKLAQLSSLSGYAGVMGDVVKALMDVQYKNKPQTYSNPLLDGLLLAGENTQFLIEAISKNDLPSVADVSNQILSDYFQAYRLGVANLSPERQKEITKQNKFRDLKVFKMGQGESLSGTSSDRANPYTDSEMKDFKRTGDIKEAAAMLPSLIKNVIEEAKGDPEKLKDGLIKLKLNSYQTMPNPSTLPKQFHDYYIWLAKTQGSEEASARLTDYLKQNTINKAKSAAVP